MTSDRSLKVVRNARAGMIRSVTGGIISVATVPLALRALGVEGYGTFQVLLSIAYLTTMSDVGLGLALFTRVGQLSGAKQFDEIRHAVGGALMVISLVVVLLASLAVGALALFDVPRFLETPGALRDQVQRGLYLIVASFVFRMPLSALGSAHGGLQIGDRLVWWNTGGAIASSSGMVVAALLTKRVDVAIGVQLALSLAGVAGAARLGCRLEPCSRPAFRWRDIAIGWSLLRSGFFYYALQVEVVLISGLDNLVIAKVMGVQAVASYNVASRIIQLAYSLVQALGGSFWPGVAHAIGNRDIPWIRSEAARLRRVGTLWMAIFSSGFAAIGVPVIALWTGNRLMVDPWLPVFLGLYYALSGHTMFDGAILNGADKIRQQIVTVGLDAVLKLALSIALAHAIGYVGVAAGTLIAYAICSFVPLQYFSWKLVAQGPRPPFWTRSLSAMVLSVAAGFAIHRLLAYTPGLGRIGGVMVGGCAALAATLAIIRSVVGPDGIKALRNSLQRAVERSSSPPPKPSP